VPFKRWVSKIATKGRQDLTSYHDSRIIDQEIDLFASLVEFSDAIMNGLEARELQQQIVYPIIASLAA
jgi:hypothetical protein